MDTIQEKVQFPFLIHRDETAIESETAEISEKHQQTAEELEGLKGSLSNWMQKELTVSEVFKFIETGNYQDELLKVYGEQNNIPANVKRSKYTEFFNVPPHSDIIKTALSFASAPRSELKKYVDKETDTFKAPEVTEAEKKRIVEKHCIYINTEADYKLYSAFKSLCDFINYINIETDFNSEGMLLEGRIREFILPVQYHRHIMPTHRGHRLAPFWSIDPQKFKR